MTDPRSCFDYAPVLLRNSCSYVEQSRRSAFGRRHRDSSIRFSHGHRRLSRRRAFCRTCPRASAWHSNPPQRQFGNCTFCLYKLDTSESLADSFRLSSFPRQDVELGMNTTAGSYALLGMPVLRDSFVSAKLRAAGAISQFARSEIPRSCSLAHDNFLSSRFLPFQS